MRDRDRRALERLPHLRLQRGDVGLQDGDVVLTPEMFCRLKLAAARLPAASVVTNEVGPDCAARLAAEVMPDIR